MRPISFSCVSMYLTPPCFQFILFTRCAETFSILLHSRQFTSLIRFFSTGNVFVQNLNRSFRSSPRYCSCMPTALCIHGVQLDGYSISPRILKPGACCSVYRCLMKTAGTGILNNAYFQAFCQSIGNLDLSTLAHRKEFKTCFRSRQRLLSSRKDTHIYLLKFSQPPETAGEHQTRRVFNVGNKIEVDMHVPATFIQHQEHLL